MLIFRLPFDEKTYTVDVENSNSNVKFFPFEGDSQLYFKGNIVEISKEDVSRLTFQLPDGIENFENENQNEYLQRIEKAIKVIQKNQLKKIVIARKKKIELQNVNLSKTFFNLCEKYPSAFVYAFVKNNNSWIGAFSEVLGKFNKNTSTFETMSLAGTLPVDEEWTEKEIEEQKPVSEYILNISNSISKNVKQSETYDHVSGNIKHLRTDFEAKIKPEHFDQLISELHPTPAVCGIPKDFCKNQISKLENFDRELYAGYTKIETDDYIYCFVNLRCGKLYKNSAILYAGGGITSLSSPEKEWRETELKFQALGENFICS